MAKTLFVIALILMAPAGWAATLSGGTFFSASQDFGGSIGVLSASAAFSNNDVAGVNTLQIVLTNTATTQVTSNPQILGVLMFDVINDANGSVATFALTPSTAFLTAGSTYVDSDTGLVTTCGGACDVASNWFYAGAGSGQALPDGGNPVGASRAIAGVSWGSLVGSGATNFAGNTLGNADGPAYGIVGAGGVNTSNSIVPVIFDSATFRFTFLDSAFGGAFHITNLAWLYGTGPGEPVLTPEPMHVGVALSLALMIFAVWRRRRTAE